MSTSQEPTIRCPNCGTDIKLTEGLAAPLIASTRASFERQLAAKDTEIAQREAKVREQADAVKKAEAAVADKVAAELQKERATVAAEAERRARAAVAMEVEAKAKEAAELAAALNASNAKLGEAQKAQAEAVRLKRALEDEKRELDLTIERRVQQEQSAIEQRARQRADEDNRLKMAEKDKLISDAQAQVEEMKRKMAQGSQQLQGEVQELDLEKRLREAFPRDTIEPVPKGQLGADAIHRVLGPLGSVCGTILWESKRTKNWSGVWTDKLKQDQRVVKADIAVIVTQAMPQGIDAFGEVDGVWVTTPSHAVALACVLRLAVTEAALARRAADGQQDKMSLLYQYLTGPQFRQRVEALIEGYTALKEELDSERRAMTKRWAEREKRLEMVMLATAGMYGDVHAIAGKSLQEIEGLELNSGDRGRDQLTS